MKRLLRGVTFQALFLLLVSCSPDSHPSGPDSVPPLITPAQPAGAFVASVDDSSGLPSFLWATSAAPVPRGATVEQAARFHLGRLAHAYHLPAEATRGAELLLVHESESGAKIVSLRQRVDGVEVYSGNVKLVLKPNLDLVAISGTLRPASAARGAFVLSPAQALATALSSHFGARVSAAQLAGRGRSEGGYEKFALVAAPAARAGTLRLDEPARVKRVYLPDGAALVPAYFVELFGSTDGGTSSDAYRYLIDAQGGKVLEAADLTADVAYNYRVWAEPGGDKRPFDGPQADYTPHPTGVSDNSDPAFIAPNLVAMEGFNVNRNGVADPWLPAGASETVGNNVDAYTDVVGQNGYSNGDLRATVTGGLSFDRVYDVDQEPLATPAQQMASVTQLFYVTNWLHDYWYGSGFDEVAGNAQQNNFGRGGVGGDVLLAEAQDFALAGARNNANMQTPADGSSPRMQMYIFKGPDVRGFAAPQLGISRGNESVTTPAMFGPKVHDVTGEVVVAVDGVAPVGDGCSAIVNDVAGKIALIDATGSCAASVKVKNAQNAGAIGVVINNNLFLPALFAFGGMDATITIGSLAITVADATAVKNALLTGPVTVQLRRQGQADRDGGIDNMIVAHEWGHYLHHRLADPCSSQQCRGTSEGWADFTSLHMALREGDNLDGTYSNGTYAARQLTDSPYLGVRRFPYSVNMAKNGLTFRHISNGQTLPDGRPSSNNSEVHNTGEVWAAMMWEVYVALQKQRLESTSPTPRTFAQVQRRMADYIVTGLQLMPAHATFTEQRDAILAAIAASDADDLAVATAAFARRGLGSCAVSAPRNSADLRGVVESFELKPVLGIGTVQVSDAALSCDSDGIVDVGETGRVTVQIVNGGALAASGTDVSVSSSSPAVVFPGGPTLHVPPIPAFGTVAVSFDIAFDADVTGIQDVQLAIAASDANACQSTVTATIALRANSDVALAASASDDVEAELTAWTVEGSGWARQALDHAHHFWHADDLASVSDLRLVSPTLRVSPTQPFVVTFKHRHQFEASTVTAGIFFDGGVIEVSSDGGHTWQDVTTFGVDPGYRGTLRTGTPLGARRALTGRSLAYPAFASVTLDFGTQLGGRSVALRFRAGSDGTGADLGWDVDDLGFAGIDNTPFHALIEDQPNVCPSDATSVVVLPAPLP